MKTKEDLQKEKEGLRLKYGQGIGKINELTVVLDENDPEVTATIFLRKSDRMATQLVRKLYSAGKYHEAIIAGLTNLYIGGDELKLVTGNDDAVMSCEGPLAEILNRQEATLKKN